jgi:pyruvate/2-oxoglutarate dehydrogenase complex dihydrolipoamide dehydrogenase (E3) component
MRNEFDVIVIGAGPAGENAAGRAAAAGFVVAVVEAELVGGECSYWGCIPSKTLIRPGDALAAVRRVPGAAEAVTGEVDPIGAFARRDYMTSSWDDSGQLPWLESHGIALVRGWGRLAGERAVRVESADGSIRHLTARLAVVLATGTSASIPPIDGLRQLDPWDNRDITSTKTVPRRLLVLGGGAIGAEMAQAFKRLGCEQVTIVEALDRLLSREEPFAGDEVRAALEAEGIIVLTGTKMTAAERRGSDGPVVATLDDGRRLDADEILVAVGRRPSTRGLGLETVGLSDAAGRYLTVDDQLHVQGVADGWLYAVGDCNGRSLHTHMGKYQGRLAADVIAGKQVADRSDPDMVPRVTFTDPQVAAVGLTEADARQKRCPVDIVTSSIGDVPGAYTLGRDVKGTAKLVIDRQRRVLLGATFTGPGVQELLHSATIAIVGEVALERLWHAVPSFPTLSEVWLHLLEAYGL